MAKAAINGGLETDLQTGLAMEAACYAQVRRAGCMSARLSAAVEMITCFPGYLLCLGASVLQFLRRGCRVLVYWCNHARTSSARVCEGVQVVSRDVFPVWPAVALHALPALCNRSSLSCRCCRRRTAWRDCAPLLRSARPSSRARSSRGRACSACNRQPHLSSCRGFLPGLRRCERVPQQTAEMWPV